MSSTDPPESMSHTGVAGSGYEAIAMIRQGQIESIEKDDVTGQISFIHEIFDLAM